jgi:hypothetical protein
MYQLPLFSNMAYSWIPDPAYNGQSDPEKIKIFAPEQREMDEKISQF